MSSKQRRCEHAELISAYVLHALPESALPVLEAHAATCAECSAQLETLRATIEVFAFWPIDVLRPSANLWQRLARRIAPQVGGETEASSTLCWTESPWEDVAPGIACKLLATDAEAQRVSMLVRLAPGAEYPPHTHAGVEELHLLHGELLIDGRTLKPGDYNRAEPGTADKHVWSRTGCTCVLITSTADVLG